MQNEKKVDNRFIKISGKIELPFSLAHDDEVEIIINRKLQVTSSVVKIEEKSNQDDSVDQIYTVKTEMVNELSGFAH